MGLFSGFYIVAYSALGVEGSHIAFNGVCYGIAAVVLGGHDGGCANGLQPPHLPPGISCDGFRDASHSRLRRSVRFGRRYCCGWLCVPPILLCAESARTSLSKQFDLPAPWVISLTTLFFRRGPGDRCSGDDADPFGWRRRSATLPPVPSLCFSLDLSVFRGSETYGLAGASFVPAPIRVRPSPQEFAVQYLALDAGLTSREMEIALCLAEGPAKSGSKIADELCVSRPNGENSCESHLYEARCTDSKEELIELVRERASSFEE